MAVIILSQSQPQQRQQIRSLYARGYKFCRSCSKWVKPGTEKYPCHNKKDRPLCPLCRCPVKIHPRGSGAPWATRSSEV
jgi:hypothetical protein